MPKLPNTLNGLQLALYNLNIKTNQDKQFLFINDYEKNIVTFTTPKNVKYLSECVKSYLLTVRLKVVQKYFTNCSLFTK